MQFAHDHRLERGWRTGRHLHPHDLAAAAAFERGLELAHEVFGLVLDLEIAVAQDAEGTVAHYPIAGEKLADVQDQEFLKWQEAVAAFRGERDEAVDLRRNRQKRAQGALVERALELECEGKAFVRDEREGVGGVHRQRREDRKDLVEEHILEMPLIFLGQLAAHANLDAVLGQLAGQLRKDHLLMRHQAAGVLVDQGKLFGGAQAIERGRGIAGAGQFAQARDADSVELVKVRGRDRQEPQALQKRHARILGFLENAPVEAKPAQLAVIEAARPAEVGVDLDRIGKGAFEKIGVAHGGLEFLCLLDQLSAAWGGIVQQRPRQGHIDLAPLRQGRGIEIGHHPRGGGERAVDAAHQIGDEGRRRGYLAI